MAGATTLLQCLFHLSLFLDSQMNVSSLVEVKKVNLFEWIFCDDLKNVKDC